MKPESCRRRSVFVLTLVGFLTAASVAFGAAETERKYSTKEDWQKSLKQADDTIDKVEKAIRGSDPTARRQAILDLQSDPVAVQRLNLRDDANAEAIRQSINTEISDIRTRTKENIKQDLVKQWNDTHAQKIKASDIEIVEPTNLNTRPEKTKVSQDWDVTVRVNGKDVSAKKIESMVNESYYNAAGGKNTFGDATPDAVAKRQHVETTDKYHSEAYKDPERLGVMGKEADFKHYTDGQDFADVMDAKGRNALDMEGVAGEYEQFRQGAKQYDNIVSKAIEVHGGTVPTKVQEGMQVMKDVAEMKISPAEGRERLAAMGETPESMTKRAGDLMEAAEKLDPNRKTNLEERKKQDAEAKKKAEAEAKKKAEAKTKTKADAPETSGGKPKTWETDPIPKDWKKGDPVDQTSSSTKKTTPAAETSSSTKKTTPAAETPGGKPKDWNPDPIPEGWKKGDPVDQKPSDVTTKKSTPATEKLTTADAPSTTKKSTPATEKLTTADASSTTKKPTTAVDAPGGKVGKTVGKVADAAGTALDVIGYGSDLNKISEGYITGDKEKIKEGVVDLGKDLAVDVVPAVAGAVAGAQATHAGLAAGLTTAEAAAVGSSAKLAAAGSVGTVLALGVVAVQTGKAASENVAAKAEYEMETEGLNAKYGVGEQRATIYTDLYKARSEALRDENGNISPEDQERLKQECDELASRYVLGDDKAKAKVEAEYNKIGKAVPEATSMDRTVGEAVKAYLEDAKDATVNVGKGVVDQAKDTASFVKTAFTGKYDGELKPGESEAEKDQQQRLKDKLKEYGVTDDIADKISKDAYGEDAAASHEAHEFIKKVAKEAAEERKKDEEVAAAKAAEERKQTEADESANDAEDHEDDADDSEESDNDSEEVDEAQSLREAEGGELPPAGDVTSVAEGPEGGSLGGFAKDLEVERTGETASDNAFVNLTTKAREQEGWNEQVEISSRITLEEGATAAQEVSRKSAVETAAAQDANSWGDAIADGIEQGVSAGLVAMGTSFGGALGDELGQRAANSLFGDPEHKNHFDDDWQPSGGGGGSVSSGSAPVSSGGDSGHTFTITQVADGNGNPVGKDSTASGEEGSTSSGKKASSGEKASSSGEKASSSGKKASSSGKKSGSKVASSSGKESGDGKDVANNPSRSGSTASNTSSKSKSIKSQKAEMFKENCSYCGKQIPMADVAYQLGKYYHVSCLDKKANDTSNEPLPSWTTMKSDNSNRCQKCGAYMDEEGLTDAMDHQNHIILLVCGKCYRKLTGSPPPGATGP